MWYRILTKDGFDCFTNEGLGILRGMSGLLANYKWRVNDWRPASVPKRIKSVAHNPEGERVVTLERRTSPLATVAKRNYEQATIVKLDSDEVLAEVYRSEHRQVLTLIESSYAAHTPTAINKLPSKPRSSRKASKQRTRNRKEK